MRQRVARLIKRKVIQIVAASQPARPRPARRRRSTSASPATSSQQAAEQIAALPEVDFVGICAGRFDLTVGVVCRDREALFDLLVNRIRPIPGVLEAEVLLMLKVLKDNYQWSPATDVRRIRRLTHDTVRRPPRDDPASGSGERPSVQARRGDHARRVAHRSLAAEPLRLALPRRLVPRGRRRQPLHRLARGLGVVAARRQPPRARRGRAHGAQGVRHRVPLVAHGLAPATSSPRSSSRSPPSRSARSSTTPPAARSSRTRCASCARPPAPAVPSSSPSWAASTAATTAPAPWARTTPTTTTPSSRS